MFLVQDRTCSSFLLCPSLIPLKFSLKAFPCKPYIVIYSTRFRHHARAKSQTTTQFAYKLTRQQTRAWHSLQVFRCCDFKTYSTISTTAYSILKIYLATFADYLFYPQSSTRCLQLRSSIKENTERGCSCKDNREILPHTLRITSHLSSCIKIGVASTKPEKPPTEPNAIANASLLYGMVHLELLSTI